MRGEGVNGIEGEKQPGAAKANSQASRDLPVPIYSAGGWREGREGTARS